MRPPSSVDTPLGIDGELYKANLPGVFVSVYSNLARIYVPSEGNKREVASFRFNCPNSNCSDSLWVAMGERPIRAQEGSGARVRQSVTGAIVGCCNACDRLCFRSDFTAPGDV